MAFARANRLPATTCHADPPSSLSSLKMSVPPTTSTMTGAKGQRQTQQIRPRPPAALSRAPGYSARPIRARARISGNPKEAPLRLVWLPPHPPTGRLRQPSGRVCSPHLLRSASAIAGHSCDRRKRHAGMRALAHRSAGSLHMPSHLRWEAASSQTHSVVHQRSLCLRRSGGKPSHAPASLHAQQSSACICAYSRAATDKTLMQRRQYRNKTA